MPGFNQGLEGYVQWPRESHLWRCQNRFLEWAETKGRHVRSLLPKGWMFMNQKEPGEVQIFYPFTAEDLAEYKSLMIDDCSEFMTTCKCRDACVLELMALDNQYLALDHHHLIICDALASHESNQFQRSLRRLLSLFSPSSKRPCRCPTLIERPAGGFRRA